MTATQLGTIAKVSNTKGRVCVVLSDSFALVAVRDVACAIVPSSCCPLLYAILLLILHLGNAA
jgi:hypothetical protein